jgi:pimeloyl-ACP methyl ester carboxylesterase
MRLKSAAKCLIAAAVCLGALGGRLRAADGAVADSRSFSVTVAGPAAARSIIFIPGLMCPGDVWAAAAARYGSTYRVHVLTLSGFGGRAPLAGDSFLPRVRDELIGYIRAARLDHPIVVGHSLGGFLAFWVAATAPDLVGPIVAVDGVPFMPALTVPSATAAMMQPQATQMRALFASMTGSQLAAQSRLSLPAMISDSANVERAAAWAASSDPATAGRAMAEVFTTDLRDDVARLHSPALLVGAAKDARDADALARLTKAYEAQVAKAPHASVLMARQARHFVMLDDPAFLFAAIDAFLDGKPVVSAEGR